jgi:hypothetical protein
LLSFKTSGPHYLRGYLERIFPNLYRFTDFGHRARSYSYLVVRKEGNLLLPGFVTSLYDHFTDIDKLGSVDLQFITHYHDLNPAFHEKAYNHFGCKPCYHRRVQFGWKKN